MQTKEELKARLVDAHRRKDWELAKSLSQEWEKAKRKRHCIVCGVRISQAFGQGPSNYCMMHRPHNTSMKLERLKQQRIKELREELARLESDTFAEGRQGPRRRPVAGTVLIILWTLCGFFLPSVAQPPIPMPFGRTYLATLKQRPIGHLMMNCPNPDCPNIEPMPQQNTVQGGGVVEFRYTCPTCGLYWKVVKTGFVW